MTNGRERFRGELGAPRYVVYEARSLKEWPRHACHSLLFDSGHVFMSKPVFSIFLMTTYLLRGQPAESPGFTLRTSAELVVLDTGVQDSRGVNITGLKRENFRVYENGKQQTIRQFANEEVPVTLGLVVDASGSMRAKRPQVIQAALGLIAASNPRDEVFVVNFNDDARLGLPKSVPFADEPNVLRRALSMDPAQGKTALNDAILLALDHLNQGRWDKKALLVVSDGGDNNSTHSLADAIAALQESRATVYTIGLFQEEDPDQNPGVLQRLTRISGGEAFVPKTLTEISGICVRIAKDIRTRYTLAYTPERRDDRGAVRKIRVLARGENGSKLTVHTRTNYILPGVSEPPPEAQRP
jgi:Ca-activated chloride channel family protein